MIQAIRTTLSRPVGTGCLYTGRPQLTLKSGQRVRWHLPVPKKQLETWANLGAQVTAKKTFGSIRATLMSSKLIAGKWKYNVYLQGSYLNPTNIYGDTDVDIVVELKGTFGSATSSLSEALNA